MRAARASFGSFASPASLASFASGALFAAGLALSGMTRPEKVLGFLDVAGAWDPSLACVMGGALAVCLLLFPRILARRAPLLDARFHLPARTRVDGRLVLGAALFGAGWGASGYCPGPALSSLVTGDVSVLAFAGAMVLGFALFELQEWLAKRRARAVAPPASPAPSGLASPAAG